MPTGKRCSGLSTGGGWGCLPATCAPLSPPTAAIPTHHCSAHQEIMPPLSVRTRTAATQATRAALLHLVLPPPALKGLTWNLKGRVACERSCPALPHPLGQRKADGPLTGIQKVIAQPRGNNRLGTLVNLQLGCLFRITPHSRPGIDTGGRGGEQLCRRGAEANVAARGCGGRGA